MTTNARFRNGKPDPKTGRAGFKMSKKTLLLSLGAVFGPALAHAQVPDVMNALDAGGRAMGMGGANSVTGSDTMAGYYNPAGLGYVQKTEVGFSIRNLPKANSLVSGDVKGAHSLDTLSNVGPTGWTHAGIAVPLSGHNGRNNGVIGISYTTGGIDQDQRFAGNNLTVGGVAQPNYSEILYNRTDFLSFAYGKSNSNQTFNWGIALLYALSHQSDNQFGIPNPVSFEAHAHGWGGLLGIEYTPWRDTVFGLSYRTPINLTSGDSSSLLYSRVPGRIQTGLAWRKDMGDNYLIAGLEASYFFNGRRSSNFDSANQTVLGAGLEYDWSSGFGWIPLRVGYNNLTSDSLDFGDRNTFTYGLGYRPPNNDWAVDLNFAKPKHGRPDFALNLLYRFGR